MEEYKKKALEWLSKEGFNEEGYTYVYCGLNSYAEKESLKSCGFRFNKILLWHTPQLLDNDYCKKTIPIHYSTVIQLIAGYGRGMYFDTSADYIKKKIKEMNPTQESASHFIEPVNGKINVTATCTGFRTIETMYGFSNIYTFAAGDDVITWFTTSDPGIEVGDTGELVGTFKKHETYNGVDTTYITRAKLK